MRNLYLAVSMVALLALVTACDGGGPQPTQTVPPPPTTAPPTATPSPPTEVPSTEAPIEPPYHGTGISLELVNNASVAVGRVYLSISGSGEQGQELLNGYSIPPGESWMVNDIPFGIYDIRAETVDGVSLGATYMQVISSLTTWEITGGDGSGWLPGTIQWASSASASSQFSDPDWSAQQATGLPDTDICGDFATAWASLEPDTVEWLELTYDIPVVPVRIDIIEVYSPGFIYLVEVIGMDGEYYQVWQGEPAQVSHCPRVLSIDVTGVEIPVNGVRIHLDQRTWGNWNEIDAVMLYGE